MITTLIDKQDNFEIVRDQIAAILALETANQMALAQAQSLDPADWDLDVYIERSNPWDGYSGSKARVVNVWFDSATADERASGVVERQTMLGTFNIDIVGFGVSRADGAGQIAGDEDAARNAQRGLMLVRNILMAGEYTYLGLRGVVGRRFPSGINSFQPPFLKNPEVDQALGIRLALQVRYDEFSPQYPPVELEYLSNRVERAEDGRLLAQVDFDYTQ